MIPFLYAKLISMHTKINTKLIKRTVADWLKVLVLLLDEAVALVLVILLLRFLEINIPVPIVIVIALLLGIPIFLIHRTIIPSFHLKPVSGSEGMIGTYGTVVDPLSPVGAVTVKGERWRAKAVDENIEVDEQVEIIGLESLTLKVKRKQP